MGRDAVQDYLTHRGKTQALKQWKRRKCTAMIDHQVCFSSSVTCCSLIECLVWDKARKASFAGIVQTWIRSSLNKMPSMFFTCET